MKWLSWLPWRKPSFAARSLSLSWSAIDEQALDNAAFTVLDLETSGLDPKRHHIVQIGAVRLESGSIALGNVWSGLVRTHGERSPESLLIHEISPQRQEQGEPLSQLMRDFARYSENTVWVAWDADFDLAFLDRAWPQAGLEQARPLILDLAELAACVLPEWRGRRLGLDDCLRYCGLPVSDRHDALGDALVSAQLMQLLIGRARQKGVVTIGQARRLMQSHKQRQAHAF
ncbi:3'-5' exonuclease [Alcaligenes aquatilis]|uniref:DNA-directed DNA polymerase n=1 Tax=Alcaligenes aquatilis TaxID=323284 RepID=A0ABY4NLB6_9BURK|nr:MULTISPECIES: 3'-5' exonuclease [Alcaligenes]UQN37132.1 3'-5' exonuclease [Alcaligenes aquatilis]